MKYMYTSASGHIVDCIEFMEAYIFVSELVCINGIYMAFEEHISFWHIHGKLILQSVVFWHMYANMLNLDAHITT